MEAAALSAKEAKNVELSVELYEKASNLYRENGSGFNAAENLAKAAKIVEPANVDKAMELLKNACELFELEDKEHYSGDTFKIAISLFLKNKKYLDCIELMKNQHRVFAKLNQQHDLHKSYLSIVVIFLFCDDYVAANNAYNEWLSSTPGFGSCAEGTAAGELLDAYQNRNPEAIKKVTGRQLFTFLDNQVCKIAKTLTVSDSLVPENKLEGNNATEDDLT